MARPLYKYMQIKLVIFTAIMFSLSLAWGPTAHFVIAAIAEADLLECDADIYDKAVTILDYLKDFTDSGDYSFLDAATYADGIKSIDWHTYSSRHFQKEMFDKDDKPFQRIKDTTIEDANIITGLSNMIDTFKSDSDSELDRRLALSLELRVLMHLVGDIHQPLHTISRKSQKYPTGDKGGALFKISGTRSTNLHEYWDRFFDNKNWSKMNAPLSDADYDFVTSYADKIMDDFPRKKLEDVLKKKSSFSDWLFTSQNIAINQVYKDINEGDKPSKDYINSNRKTLLRQLALAGYRLADTLIYILDDIMLPYTEPATSFTDSAMQTDPLNKSLSVYSTLEIEIRPQAIQKKSLETSNPKLLDLKGKKIEQPNTEREPQSKFCLNKSARRSQIKSLDLKRIIIRTQEEEADEIEKIEDIKEYGELDNFKETQNTNSQEKGDVQVNEEVKELPVDNSKAPENKRKRRNKKKKRILLI